MKQKLTLVRLDDITTLNTINHKKAMHYVIVDNSKIKEGDWMLSHSKTICRAANSTLVNASSIEGSKCRKITHVTQKKIFFMI